MSDCSEPRVLNSQTITSGRNRIMTVLLLALLPCIILMVVVYRQDRVEREPVKLLIKLVVLGCVSTIPALFLEQAGYYVLFFDLYLSVNSVLYKVLLNFVVISCVEEGLKHLVLRMGSWKNQNFNYVFDGIVYAVFVSLGFAAVENVGYLLVYGIGIAPLRAVTAVSVHCITGIFMGHYYGLAKYCSEAGDRKGRTTNLWLSFLVPAVLHGLYDYSAGSAGSAGWEFILVVILLDIRMIRRVRRYAAADHPVAAGRSRTPGTSVPSDADYIPYTSEAAGRFRNSRIYYDSTKEYLQNEVIPFAEKIAQHAEKEKAGNL